MTKSDLRTGMRVKFRSAEYSEFYVVFVDEECLDIKFVRDGGHLTDRHIGENLKYGKGSDEWDVLAVYSHPTNPDNFLKPNAYGSLLWERKETKKMTVAEVCEALGYEVEIVK